MNTVRPRRSVLYLPADNARVLEKARSLDADALIFDLEDAVAPQNKANAREAMRSALAAGGYGNRERIVRINTMAGAEAEATGTEDLLAAVAAGADAVLVPKIETAAEVGRVVEALDAMDALENIGLWLMIETPRAILEIAAIAAAATVTTGTVLVIGTNDLARETGASLENDRLALVPWIQSTVIAARAHGHSVLDGVYNDIADTAGLEAECRQGRSLGLDGKTLIHPSQIRPANTAFGPTADEIDRARAIVAAFEAPQNRHRGVIRLEGRMVERLHREMALRTLAIADAIAATDNSRI